MQIEGGPCPTPEIVAFTANADGEIRLSPDEIKAIRLRAGMSASVLAETLGLVGTDGRHIRMIESGERSASGPIVRLLEMLDRGELPERYLAAPRKRGRPAKVPEA